MTRRTFQVLLAEFFRNMGAASARSVPGAGLCEHRGLAIAIYHDERTDPHHVDAYIDFGAVPEARQREVFRSLLQRSVDLTPPLRSVIGLDGASGSIVLITRIPFDAGLSGQRLADTVRELIRQVLIWRPSTLTPRLPTGRRRASRAPS